MKERTEILVKKEGITSAISLTIKIIYRYIIRNR